MARSTAPAPSLVEAATTRAAGAVVAAAEMALPLPLAATRHAATTARGLLRGAPRVRRASENLTEMMFRGRLADVRPSPHTVVVDEAVCTVRRHDPAGRARRTPIVLVPPLGAPARVYDLRRGASMAAHLTDAGFRVYVIDFGRVGLAERSLTIENFVDGAVGRAVEVASAQAQGGRVVLGGWCAGGVFAALHTASRGSASKVGGLALLASPLDLRRGHPYYPLYRLPITAAALRLARETGLPAPLVSLAFRLTQPRKQLMKPLTLLRNLDDREFLAHFETLDEYVGDFAAYPGRAGYTLVRSLGDGTLADGRLRVGRRIADPRRITVPTLVVSGDRDVLAPPPCVAAWTEVIRDTEYHAVGGGHLGVIAGRSAPDVTWALLTRFAAQVDRRESRRPQRRSAPAARRTGPRLRVVGGGREVA